MLTNQPRVKALLRGMRDDETIGADRGNQAPSQLGRLPPQVASIQITELRYPGAERQ